MKILAKIALLLLCLLLVALLAALAYAFTVTAGTRLDTEKLAGAKSSLAVYDADEELISTISLAGTEKCVPLGEIPAAVQNAFVAAEDKHFYSHHGLDYRGILRALWKNIRTRSFAQGASTISQQLIKNTQLSAEKTLSRKLKEIKLTKKLEKTYTKAQILEMYLNTIYFGHSCYGIASAAEYYFGKSAADLTPAEGAMLAAIIRSPNRYSPFINAEKCKNVRNSILARMQSLDYLSTEDAAAAQNAPLPSAAAGEGRGNTYLSAVRDELQNIPLASPYSLLHGCKIYTYMKASLQAYIEELKTDADRSGKSILICDNRSGGAAAWFTTEGTFRRQPGSLLKPLAVYAPAIEENLLSPCTPLLDERTNFAGYQPENYKGIYHGYVSAREALSQSLNVPAVKVLNSLGIDRAKRYLNKLDLPLCAEDETLALALGGMREGYTLRQLVGAYSTFANKGKYRPVVFIRRIEDENGRCLYKDDRAPQKVFSDDSAELINDMLTEAAKSGTAKKLSALPFPICAKTGTCGTEAGNTDAYTIAYTSAYTTGVWMGNADNTLTDITGGGLPCHYAMLINRRLHADQPPAPLPTGKCTACTLDKIAYKNDHTVLLAAERQPKQYTMADLFRPSNTPQETSVLFSTPTANATIRCTKNVVTIQLCQTEYYEYRIKRRSQEKTECIFEGKCEGIYRDTSVKADTKYTYLITPYFVDDSGEKVYGKEIQLPTVFTRPTADAPSPPIADTPWWEN